MVPFDELFPHGEVFVLHGNHSQFVLDSTGPLTVFASLSGLMFRNRLMINDSNLCIGGRHVRIET